MNISAKLNYVSATQELADELFGKGVIKPPVVEMASANTMVEVAKSDTIKKVSGFTLAFPIIVIIISFARIKRNST